MREARSCTWATPGLVDSQVSLTVALPRVGGQQDSQSRRGPGQDVLRHPGHLVVLQVQPTQLVQAGETVSGDVADPVVVEVDVGEVAKETATLHSLDVVEAGIESVEVVATGESVVVANLLDLVVVDVQPLETPGDEGEVEPAEMVGGDIEPVKVDQGRDQSIHVLQLVVVQSQGPQVGQVLQTSLLDGGETVVGQVEDIEVGESAEDVTVDVSELVTGQSETVQLDQAGELLAREIAEEILTQVEGFQVDQREECVRETVKLVVVEVQVLQYQCVSEQVGWKSCEVVVVEGEGVEGIEVGK